MAEQTIVGVDFSGAKDEGKTWVAEGRLPSAGHLIIDRIQPFLRNDLLELLQHAPPSTVVALDFPFGLPKVFLESLGIHAATMKEVWHYIAAMSFNEYKNECKGFGTHPKRTGDKHYPVSLSALNSRLVPMTYRGIEMLHSLDKACLNRWCIPPLCSGEATVDRITLLEVMPGAFLSAIGLDWATVKGYKGADSLDARDRVINRLAAYEEIKVTNLLHFRTGFRANDDCLDSVVAALAAALWASDRQLFLHPIGEELSDATLEGWIYAPKK